MHVPCDLGSPLEVTWRVKEEVQYLLSISTCQLGFWYNSHIQFKAVRLVYAPQFLSRHNKDLDWWTLKPPQHVTALGSWTDCVVALKSRADRVIALRQISVTALFYLDNSRKIHLRGVRACRPKDAKRRAPQQAGEREKRALAPLFVFLSLGLSYVNWASHECCLFYLRFSLWSLDLPLFNFRGFFPSRSFSHHHSGLLFPILTT